MADRRGPSSPVGLFRTRTQTSMKSIDEAQRALDAVRFCAEVLCAAQRALDKEEAERTK